MTTLSSIVQGAIGYTAVNKAGDTMTGALSVPASASGTQVPQVQEVVKKSGDTINGNLTINGVTTHNGTTSLVGGSATLYGNATLGNPAFLIIKSVDAESQIGITDSTRNTSVYLYNAFSGNANYVGIYQSGTNGTHLVNRDITNNRNIYPSAVVDTKFDSGWFTASVNNVYSFTHNLGRRPKLCSLIYTDLSGNQNDTATVWWLASVAAREGDGTTTAPRTGQTLLFNSTSVSLYTAYDRLIHPDPKHNYWTGASGTTGYFRIFAS